MIHSNAAFVPLKVSDRERTSRECVTRFSFVRITPLETPGIEGVSEVHQGCHQPPLASVMKWHASNPRERNICEPRRKKFMKLVTDSVKALLL